jgi:hypothetical protein
MPHTSSYHSERMLSEPCVNCGHPADAHSMTCKYTVFDYDDIGAFGKIIPVPGSEQECGCSTFVGVESGQ